MSVHRKIGDKSTGTLASPATVASASALDDAIAWLYSLQPSKIRLGLERTEALLAGLGNPHLAFPSIHITGTTGKGSTAAMLESILRAAGYTTGLYTSPHLFDVRERFRVNGQSIAIDEVVALTKQLQKIQATVPDATFHEVTTALAFSYFAAQSVDIAIVEACMGGRLDTTNVITPIVSIITNIGIDHTQWLGNTKQAIATEKAGIIKRNVPLVTAEHDPVIRSYLASVCATLDADCYHAIQRWEITALKSDWQQQSFQVARRRTSEVGALYTLGLIGEHQLDNVRGVLQAVDILRSQGWSIGEAAVIEGLATVNWPGRIQVVSTQPLIIIDGANNRDSTRALRDYLDAAVKRFDVLVYAKKEDKEYAPVLDLLVPLFDHVIVTEGLFRPESAPAVASRIRQKNQQVEVIPNAAEATARGLALTPPDGTMLVTGSLYMIPEALTYLRDQGLYKER